MCVGKTARRKIWCGLLTRVRITVRAGDQNVVREGSGTGEATATSPGLAHEFAAKAAETDATKRALSTFGNLSAYPSMAAALIRDGPEKSALVQQPVYEWALQKWGTSAPEPQRRKTTSDGRVLVAA